MYVWVSYATIESDNGLPPVRQQAIIETNAGLLIIRPLGRNLCEILIKKSKTISFKKIHLKMSSAKCRPFPLDLDMLIPHASPFVVRDVIQWVWVTVITFYDIYVRP